MKRHSRLMCLLTIGLFSFSSCTRFRLMKEMKDVVGTQITLPQSLEYLSGTDSSYENQDRALATILIWYDSTMCSTCKLSGLQSLAEIELFCRDSVDNAIVSVIFSPPVIAHKTFREASSLTKRDYPIQVDYEGDFIRENSQLPKTGYMHTFLLDRDGKVVLVGDPVSNPVLWRTYKKYLYELNENGGNIFNNK